MKSTVSQKGQVTIPKALRERLGLTGGTVLDFEAREGALVARKRRDRAPLDSVYGILGRIDVDKELARARGPAWSDEKDAPGAKRRR